MITITMDDTQQCTVALTAKDTKGTPRKLASAPKVAINNPSIAMIQQSADGSELTIVAKEAGTADITVEFGGKLPNSTIVLNVVAEVAEVSVVAGDPVQQPGKYQTYGTE